MGKGGMSVPISSLSWAKRSVSITILFGLETRLNTTWKVILKALLSKAFKITFFSVLARRNGD